LRGIIVVEKGGEQGVRLQGMIQFILLPTTPNALISLISINFAGFL